MAKQYLVIDVETPNHNNDRISAIAVTRIINETIQGQRYFLVNPEADFDSFNVELTGITPMDVAGAPAFPEVWEQIREDFSNSTIVAHNAPFDLTVLSKVCNAYGIPFDSPTYIDTVQMSRRALPDLDHHRLNDVCDALSLELEHHRADSDCTACAEAFLHCIRTGLEPDEFERVYRRKSDAENRVGAEGNERVIHSRFGDIRISFGRGAQSSSKRDYSEETAKFLAVHAYDGPVSFAGASICLSGEFSSYSKSELTARLEQKGAIVRSGVSKKTDYLFVGSQGNAQWAAGSYGAKVKKALMLQDEGFGVRIVTESVLFKALESAPDAEAPAPESKVPGNPEQEQAIFQQLLPVLETVEKRNFLPLGGISLAPGNAYSSVFVHGNLVCRICWRKSKYIAVKGTPEQYPDLTSFRHEQKKAAPGFTSVLLKSETEVPQLLPLIEQVAQDAVDQITKDFDCCSRFEQCSAERACIHPDPEFAKACGYRKKLAHGIVFAAGKD